MLQKLLVPLIMPLLSMIVPTVSDESAKVIGTFVEHNPALSMYIVAGLWFVFHLLPSPIQAKVAAKDMPKE